MTSREPPTAPNERQVVTIPWEAWAQLVAEIQGRDDPALNARLDQILPAVGSMTVRVKPFIPSHAAIPWETPSWPATEGGNQ